MLYTAAMLIMYVLMCYDLWLLISSFILVQSTLVHWCLLALPTCKTN